MRRILFALCVLAFLAAVPLSHSVFAVPPDGNKALICHITGLGIVKGEPGFVGHVIEVSVNAIPAHCAHGDHSLVVGSKVKGDDCGRKIEGAVAKCDGADPVAPHWYQEP